MENTQVKPIASQPVAAKPNGTPVAAANVPTTAELLARIAQLESEKALRDKASMTLKVSDKGAVSVYGMGRFPVTLYAAQWERILAAKEMFLEFIKAHPELQRKDAK